MQCGLPAKIGILAQTGLTLKANHQIFGGTQGFFREMTAFERRACFDVTLIKTLYMLQMKPE